MKEFAVELLERYSIEHLGIFQETSGEIYEESLKIDPDGFTGEATKDVPGRTGRHIFE